MQISILTPSMSFLFFKLSTKWDFKIFSWSNTLIMSSVITLKVYLDWKGFKVNPLEFPWPLKSINNKLKNLEKNLICLSQFAQCVLEYYPNGWYYNFWKEFDYIDNSIALSVSQLTYIVSYLDKLFTVLALYAEQL